MSRIKCKIEQGRFLRKTVGGLERVRENSREQGAMKRFFTENLAVLLLFVASSGCFCATSAAKEIWPRSEQAAAAQASSAKARFEQGQAALQAGDLDAAEKAFRGVLENEPNSAAAYANLGVIAMRRKSWDAALGDLRKAEKLAPRLTGVRLNIGLVEFHRGRYAEAIAPLESVLRDQPGSGKRATCWGCARCLRITLRRRRKRWSRCGKNARAM